MSSLLRFLLLRVTIFFLISIVRTLCSPITFSSTHEDALDFAICVCLFIMSVSFTIASRSSRKGNPPKDPPSGGDGGDRPGDSIIRDEDRIIHAPGEMPVLELEKLYLLQKIQWLVSQVYASFIELCNRYSLFSWKIQFFFEYTVANVNLIYASLVSLLKHPSFQNTGLIDYIRSSLKILEALCGDLIRGFYTVFGKELLCKKRLFSFFEDCDKWYTYHFSKIFDLVEACTGMNSFTEGVFFFVHTFGPSSIPLVLSTIFCTQLVPYGCRLALLYLGKNIVLKKLLKLLFLKN